jgi:hypothetical protein
MLLYKNTKHPLLWSFLQFYKNIKYSAIKVTRHLTFNMFPLASYEFCATLYIYSIASCPVVKNYGRFERSLYFPLQGQAVFNPKDINLQYCTWKRTGTSSLLQRLATSCKVRGSIPVTGKIFRTSSEGSCGTPSLLYKIPGVKQPGYGVSHGPFLAPRLKKDQSHTYTHLLCIHGRLQSEINLYFTWKSWKKAGVKIKTFLS